jgi:UDP-N-acetylglucosamine--N-acetylmuramyl-(pentapeptide) pyrophosphoryl-undecaprenol N-acetylglucosamine transferase
LRERALGDSLELLFVGTRQGIEATAAPAAGLNAAFVASRPLTRRLSFDVLRTAADNAVGFVQAVRVIARFRPDAVVATGGYVSVPVVLAARALRLARRSRARIALLEPNAVPGLANRLLGPLVDELWVSFADPAARTPRNAVLTGTPVRASVLSKLSPEAARRMLGLRPDGITIVVMGGSQGAQRINDAVTAMVSKRALPDGWQVLLVSGRGDAERVKAALSAAGSPPAVVLVPYLDDPGAAYAAAEVVVARAGASTLAELAATGTPSILVPYPHAAAAHQQRNAEAAHAAGTARVVPDAELEGERLRSELLAALEPSELARARAAAGSLAATDPRARIAARVGALLERG